MCVEKYRDSSTKAGLCTATSTKAMNNNNVAILYVVWTQCFLRHCIIQRPQRLNLSEYVAIFSLPNYQTLYLFRVHISLPGSIHSGVYTVCLCYSISTLKYSATVFSTILINPTNESCSITQLSQHKASEQNILSFNLF
jgi:hypothetical protein